jgi:hypothetical protein
MGSVYTKMGGKTVVSAVIIKADGTKVDLGVIASTEKKKLTLLEKIKKFALGLNSILL